MATAKQAQNAHAVCDIVLRNIALRDMRSSHE
jgi:hypothetical protein